MKKIIIILSVIMLSGTFCFGQDKLQFQASTTKRIDSLGGKITDITLENTKGKKFSFMSTDSTIVKIDSLVYERDSSKANFHITGIGYGLACIKVIDTTNASQADTIFRIIMVGNDTTAVIAMCDTIASLRKRLSTLPSTTSSDGGANEGVANEGVANKGRQNENILKNPFFISICGVAVILLALFVLFFILNKKKKTKIDKYEQQQQDDAMKLAAIEKEKNNLQKEKDNLLNEKERSKEKEEKEKLKNELRLKEEEEKQKEELRRKKENEQKLQSLSLYAKSIYDGKFNNVKETPDENTVFELKLNRVGDTSAKIIVYREACRKVIANPAYLEGCEKQILGNTTVTMLREGIATKDDSGNWIIHTKPEVKIS